jgi:hypothetical protein
MSLTRIEALPPTTGVVAANETAPLGRAGEVTAPTSFEALLGGAIDQVNSLNAVAEQKTQALAAGAIHQARRNREKQDPRRFPRALENQCLKPSLPRLSARSPPRCCA